METVSNLREQVKSLWEKLEVDQTERVDFLSHHAGFKRCDITAVSNKRIVQINWSLPENYARTVHGINHFSSQATIFLENTSICP